MAPSNSLSKALGTAFLQHQVDQLESQANFHSNSHSRGGGRGGSRGRGRARGLWEPGLGRGGGKVIILKKDAQDLQSQPQKDEREELGIIPHISVLLYALPLLKSWIREGRSVLIPLHLISQLDALKSSNSSLSPNSREAIRYLESQFARHRTTRSDPKSPPTPLIAQNVREEIPWGDTEPYFQPPPSSTSHPEAQQVSIADTPNNLRPLLQYALYLKHKSSIQSAFYVYPQPLSSSSTSTTESTSTLSSQQQSMVIDVDGDIQWFRMFGLSIEHVSEQDAHRAQTQDEERRKSSRSSHRNRYQKLAQSSPQTQNSLNLTNSPKAPLTSRNPTQPPQVPQAAQPPQPPVPPTSPQHPQSSKSSESISSSQSQPSPPFKILQRPQGRSRGGSLFIP